MRNLLSLFVLGCALANHSPAQTFTTLYNFDLSGATWPNTVLVQGTDGNFYGTTQQIGTNTSGTVYQITPSGTFLTLASFFNNNGVRPWGGLTLAIGGKFFYGTTFFGSKGDGTVFRITPEGALTTLHAFDGTDGGGPQTTLVQTPDRNFYGTTSLNSGAIFKMTPGGAVTNLYVFSGPDGAEPTAMIQALDGNFYGATGGGGFNNAGTIFQITPDGALITLYAFCGQPGCADGQFPQSLFQASDGNFYGVTANGGAYQKGTVFVFRPATGTLTTMYNFYKQRGIHPNSMMQATDGNLYGTTSEFFGTIFMIDAAGALTILHTFDGSDGSEPNSLLQSTDGDFYGTTLQGGSSFEGTVFRLSVGLGPFVKTLPTIGHVGATVEILGTNLTGATAVMFNGVAAAFTVVSATEITATVPAGATTGKVQVTTPGGALLSNVAYRVFP